MKELLKEVHQACEEDIHFLCAGIQPGGGRIAACLKQSESDGLGRLQGADRRGEGGEMREPSSISRPEEAAGVPAVPASVSGGRHIMERTNGRPSPTRAIAAAIVAALLAAACAGNGGGGMSGVMGTDTGKGALFGGATGALIGGLVDHADPAVGILVGAAGGALAGGLIGHHMDTQKQNLSQVLQPEVNAGDASVQLLKNHGVLVDMTGKTRFAPSSAVATARSSAHCRRWRRSRAPTERSLSR